MSKYFNTNITSSSKILSPNEVHQQLPSTLHQKDFVLKARQTVRDIMDGVDKRLLLILGPCSIHDPFSAKEYAKNIKSLQERFGNRLFFVMRVHLEKPRTLAGWKGFLNDPHLSGSLENDLGIRRSRLLLLELAEMQVPVATEFLTPYIPLYLEDLIAWGSIGARTSASPIHRQLASGLSMPVGFKNSIEGDLTTALNGTLSATQPQNFFGIDMDGSPAIIHTTGNAYSHLVLRGGKERTNYDAESVLAAHQALKECQLKERVLIDCSHDNSRKKAVNQPKVFLDVLEQIKNSSSPIFGLMLESYLNDGNQPWQKNVSELQYGLSITDECLGWNATEALVETAADRL